MEYSIYRLILSSNFLLTKLGQLAGPSYPRANVPNFVLCHDLTVREQASVCSPQTLTFLKDLCVADKPQRTSEASLVFGRSPISSGQVKDTIERF